MTTDVQPQTTFSLAKALHYVYFAKAYFEDVIISEKLTGSSKEFIQNLINRQQWILNTCYTRMSAETAKVLRDELEGRDIATIDSILNMIVMLDESQRLEIEDYITDKYLNK